MTIRASRLLLAEFAKSERYHEVAVALRPSGKDVEVKVTPLDGKDRRDSDVQICKNYGIDLIELSERPGFKIGWVEFEQGVEVLYFYDAADSGFGWAMNLADPWSSEWGDSPFETEA